MCWPFSPFSFTLKVKHMASTIYSDTKGRSYKTNLSMNQEPHLDSNSQAVLREKGVIPATIGILKGQVHAARWSDGIFETLIDLVDFGCLVFCWLEIPREEDTAHVGMAFGSLQNWEGWRLDDGMHIGFPISGWSLNPSDHNLGTRLSFENHLYGFW